MKPKTTFVALLLGTALAVAPAAGAKVVLDGGNSGTSTGITTFRPSAMTAAEYRALVIRGTALNAVYGNHITDLSPQQFKKAFDEGMARANGTVPATSGSVQPSNSNGWTFHWNDALIAAAAAMLLALAFVGVTRRRHHRLGV
jgi:hypothetical protein